MPHLVPKYSALFKYQASPTHSKSHTSRILDTSEMALAILMEGPTGQQSRPESWSCPKGWPCPSPVPPCATPDLSKGRNNCGQKCNNTAGHYFNQGFFFFSSNKHIKVKHNSVVIVKILGCLIRLKVKTVGLVSNWDEELAIIVKIEARSELYVLVLMFS